MLKFAPFIILLAAAAPATAQNAPAAPASQAKADPLDKIVCRTEEGLGSRLNRKRVCMSLRDWRNQADDARNATEKMQQMNSDQKKPDG